MYLIQSMVMYKPVFHDSIIAVSIAVRYTISPKLVIGDATFYYIASLLKKFFFFKLGPIVAILVNSMYLEYWSIGIFYPLHYFLYNDFQSLTFRHKTDILYKNLHLLTKFTLNGGHFEYLDFSN